MSIANEYRRDRYDTNLVFWDALAITATGNLTSTVIAHAVPNGAIINLDVNTVAGSASATLDVVVSGSADNSTYVEIMDFPQITAAGISELALPNDVDYLYYKMVATVAGTNASFTTKSWLAW